MHPLDTEKKAGFGKVRKVSRYPRPVMLSSTTTPSDPLTASISWTRRQGSMGRLPDPFCNSFAALPVGFAVPSPESLAGSRRASAPGP